MEQMRLSRYLSQNSVCSRRAAEELIKQGRLKINGVTAQLGDKVDPDKDKILLDGKAVRQGHKARSYFMLNKPRGYVTTLKDESGRKCVADLISRINARVFYAGRLDKDSEGLLILTDDGELANKLVHPSKHISKVYRVTVKTPHVSLDVLKQLRTGVVLDDGYKTLPAEVKVSLEDENKTVLLITIYEGKNRQIRRMCEAVGLEVMLLKRIAYGKLRLGGLRTGQYRILTDEEIAYLKSL